MVKIISEILKLIQICPISTKQLQKMFPDISKNYISVCLYKLKRKGLIVKGDDKKYHYINPLNSIKSKSDYYKSLLENITPRAKGKAFELLRDSLTSGGEK